MAKVTIQATDVIATSRTDINSNFTELYDNKIETSTLDTDTALTANSNTKIATQAAVKAYVDAGGNVNASETARGIVEEATDAQVTAGTATGETGAKLFITPTKLATRLPIVLATYQPLSKSSAGTINRDLTTVSGVQNIAHGLGVAPIFVKIRGLVIASDYLDETVGIFSGSGNTGMTFQSNSGTNYYFTSATQALGHNNEVSRNPFAPDGNCAYCIISVDATNIILTWTKFNSPTGTMEMMWEAQY